MVNPYVSAMNRSPLDLPVIPKDSARIGLGSLRPPQMSRRMRFALELTRPRPILDSCCAVVPSRALSGDREANEQCDGDQPQATERNMNRAADQLNEVIEPVDFAFRGAAVAGDRHSFARTRLRRVQVAP